MTFLFLNVPFFGGFPNIDFMASDYYIYIIQIEFQDERHVFVCLPHILNSLVKFLP